MTTLDELRPQRSARVMDLLVQAGFDVSDWANYALGTRLPTKNPRYCYEWGFLQEGHGVLLFLWFDELESNSTRIYQKLNYRALAARLRAEGAKGAVAERARRSDYIVQCAHLDELPVRVVVCSRAAGRPNRSGFKKSAASKRMLDSEPWFIRQYDNETGAAIVERGEALARFVDQFALREVIDEGGARVPQRQVETWAFVRSAAVRATALRRARGRCELCGAPGFELADGRLYLETHHVQPLSEGGPDTPENVVALCANHHREIHYGAATLTLRNQLLMRSAISNSGHAT